MIGKPLDRRSDEAKSCILVSSTSQTKSWPGRLSVSWKLLDWHRLLSSNAEARNQCTRLRLDDNGVGSVVRRLIGDGAEVKSHTAASSPTPAIRAPLLPLRPVGEEGGLSHVSNKQKSEHARFHVISNILSAP